MTSAVLWDLDGTLVDSEAYHWRSWRDTMALESVALTYAQFLASFGKRNDLILRGWLGPDASADCIRRVGDAKEEEYRRMARTEGLQPLPGAAELVARLHDAGWKQAIASSAPRANVDVVIEALGFQPYIDAIVAAEDVTRGKPAPDVFLEGARRLGVAPDHCIVVEDAAAGIAAARAAGMKCIGVSRHVTLSEADIVVPSLADLDEAAFGRLVAGQAAPGGDSAKTSNTVAPDLESLVAQFTACTLPREHWTHAAHLAVGLWHVHRYGADEALTRLRAGIRRLNDSHGTVNSSTSGYHETITRGYLQLLAQFLDSGPDGMSLTDRVAVLVASPVAERDVLFTFWSRDTLMSEDARRAWVEPDVSPLLLNRVATSVLSSR